MWYFWDVVVMWIVNFGYVVYSMDQCGYGESGWVVLGNYVFDDFV